MANPIPTVQAQWCRVFEESLVEHLKWERFYGMAPPKLNRRQRLARYVSVRVHRGRERLALRIAPWLDREGWYS